jgi:glycerophosphoryl diester phosphodiesterase
VPAIIAHRGLSSRFPEMTRAAYRAAIEWAAATGSPLGLECDVHFAADDQLVCLHDLTLHRTAAIPRRVIDLTVEQLKQIDFGSWLQVDPAEDQRELVTLAELLAMVRTARADGIAVTLVIETKHPNPRALEVEDRLAEMLAAMGWDGPDAPVRLISFSLAALDRLGELLPVLPRSLLVEFDLEPWRDGRLPDGIRAVGPHLRLLRTDPGFVARARAHGNEVHPWTVNHPDDIRFCAALGVTCLTTDYPDLVTEVITADPLPIAV